MIEKSRTPIPEPIKRQLRQEAGFGCVKCGYPIYDYHHIIQWSKEQHNRLDDMMIVCPNHHREMPLLSEIEQRRLKSKPYNILKGLVNGSLLISQKAPIVVLGGTEIVNYGPLLCFKDKEIISLKFNKDGQVLISLNLHDCHNQLMLCIVDNEWIYGNPKVWDIKFKGNKLLISEKSGEISFLLDASGAFLKIKGLFWLNDTLLKITDDGLEFKHLKDTNFFSGIYSLCHVNSFIKLSDNSSSGAITIEVNKKYGNGWIVSQETVEKRLVEAIRLYSTILDNIFLMESHH